MSITTKLLQSPVFQSQCIQVVQQLTKQGVLKARVIGNSQNSSIVEQTRDVAMKYSLDAKLEPIIIKKNKCNDALLCGFVCDTIYTENYNSDGDIVSIKVEKTIPP